MMTNGRDSSATPGPDIAAVRRDVNPEALFGDLVAAKLDHRIAGDDKAASDADRTASDRDDTAQRRERRALLVEEAIAGSDAPVAAKVEQLREQAAHDRAGAAADRERAAEERSEATAERARLEAELHGAYLDGLTGAFRREVGRHALALEIDRARQADGRFVLARIDVDGLEGINERAGHATGDHVLRTLVGIMRSGLRSYDPIVRMGGDDFACGIAGAELDEVDLLFYEVERSMQADTGVGISVGTAALADGESIEQITARADAALLAAQEFRPA
jgi:diguanylate cyclase (GGDEF)-like protein